MPGCERILNSFNVSVVWYAIYMSMNLLKKNLNRGHSTTDLSSTSPNSQGHEKQDNSGNHHSHHNYLDIVASVSIT